MYIEFETKPENGFIKIPDEYIKVTSENLKVILICNEQSNKNDDIEQFFGKYSVNMNSFTFNREEANAR